jgi:ankyrin repeat protein
MREILKETGLTEYGETRLHLATKDNNIEEIINEIKNGTDVNAECDFGFRPLDIALIEKNLQIITYLLDNDADPTLFDKYGNSSAYHIAAQDGRLDLIELFLKYKGTIHIRYSETSETLLHSAMYGFTTEFSNIRCFDVVKFLINNNIDYSLKNSSGETARDCLENSYYSVEDLDLIIEEVKLLKF